MSRGQTLPDLHNFCRFCLSNQKINGTLQHIRNIFQSLLPKKKSSGPPIADILRSLGVRLSEQDLTKSHRICEKCYRQVLRVQESMKILEKWREKEGCKVKDTPTKDIDHAPTKSPAPSAGGKRALEQTPSEAPHDSRKRLKETPPKTAVTSDAQLVKKNMSHLPARTSVTKVTINYPSNPGKVYTHQCVSEVSGIVENLAKGNLGTSAKLIMHHPALTSHIMEQLKEKAKAEVTSLMATSPSPSILRKTTPHDLQNFNYSDMEAELKARAPLLHTVLSTVSDNSTVHTCVAASVAIRGTEPRLSALAYTIDAILQCGGTTKSAKRMLSKMGVCTNQKKSVAKQHQMCQSNDETVMEWKRDVELFANKPTDNVTNHPADNNTAHPTDSTTPLPANSAMDITSPLPANSAMDSTSLFPANSVMDSTTPLPANSSMASTSPLPANSAMDSTSPLPANSAMDSMSPPPANSAMDSTSPPPANSAMDSTSPPPSNSAMDSTSPLPTNSAMDSTSPLAERM